MREAPKTWTFRASTQRQVVEVGPEGGCGSPDPVGRFLTARRTSRGAGLGEPPTWVPHAPALSCLSGRACQSAGRGSRPAAPVPGPDYRSPRRRVLVLGRRGAYLTCSACGATLRDPSGGGSGSRQREREPSGQEGGDRGRGCRLISTPPPPSPPHPSPDARPPGGAAALRMGRWGYERDGEGEGWRGESGRAEGSRGLKEMGLYRRHGECGALPPLQKQSWAKSQPLPTCGAASPPGLGVEDNAPHRGPTRGRLALPLEGLPLAALQGPPASSPQLSVPCPVSPQCPALWGAVRE